MPRFVHTSSLTVIFRKLPVGVRMRKFSGRTSIRIAATAVLLMAAALFHITVAPGQAQARCDGHTEVRSQLIDADGDVYAEEWPQAGTCNSNNAYHGYFRSTALNSRASVWIQNNGTWRGWYCPYGQTCAYSYTDNNHHSYIHLCINGTSIWSCGWGRTVYHFFTHNAYGVNWAY